MSRTTPIFLPKNMNEENGHTTVQQVVRYMGIAMLMLVCVMGGSLIISLVWIKPELAITTALIAGVSNLAGNVSGFIGGVLSNAFPRSAQRAADMPSAQAIGQAVTDASQAQPLKTNDSDVEQSGSSLGS